MTPNEVITAIRSRRKINSAPGPDGLGIAIWKRISPFMVERMASCFTSCLRRGCFPSDWKIASLVLIPKEGYVPVAGDLDGQLPKVRPICLLNYVAKLFEYVIVQRMQAWMGVTPRANLTPRQFGFRQGLSTCDAIRLVKEEITEAVRQGKKILAISLDIKNTFNTIPWRAIRTCLREKKFPKYIRRIIDSYLDDRWIQFVLGDGSLARRRVRAGVPQGSILGPILWNLAFDGILRMAVPDGSSIVAYADNTLILVAANNIERLINKANSLVRGVVDRIQGLGLQIAEQKTEVVLFGSRVSLGVRVGASEVQIRKSMKYLGIFIDGRWSFRRHFVFIEDKILKVTRALGRLMPNLRGPSESKKRLYYNVLLSVVMYGAPRGDVMASRWRDLRALQRVQKEMALRVISGYRTVAFDAALLLARVPPFFMVATMLKRIFVGSRELRSLGE